MNEIINYSSMFCKECSKPLPLNKCVTGNDYCSRECAEESLNEKEQHERVSKR